jgi:hypothetical protein
MYTVWNTLHYSVCMLKIFCIIRTGYTLSLFGGFDGPLLTKTAAVGALQFLKKY